MDIAHIIVILGKHKATYSQGWLLVIWTRSWLHYSGWIHHDDALPGWYRPRITGKTCSLLARPTMKLVLSIFYSTVQWMDIAHIIVILGKHKATYFFAWYCQSLQTRCLLFKSKSSESKRLLRPMIFVVTMVCLTFLRVILTWHLVCKDWQYQAKK
jgi:hypothetical protein